ncbi:MAG TPA: peptidylprolyl isomerase, partial [Candidatus Egerieicola pullicola]|nr:peptidylprolyl isomerase [Candidatus Egerieicola pullicola]
QQFEDTVKSLDLNEVSGIIKTSYGYHIVKRVPLTEEDIQETAQSLAAQQADQSDTFADWVYDQVDAANVEYCDQYDLITPDTMK